MTHEELNAFAKAFVQNVRDMAIRSCDAQLYTSNMKSPTARRWRNAMNNEGPEKFAEMVIADSVDDALFYFLLAVDEGVFNISYNSPKGNEIKLTADVIGELGGYYMGEWSSQLSAERCWPTISLFLLIKHLHSCTSAHPLLSSINHKSSAHSHICTSAH